MYSHMNSRASVEFSLSEFHLRFLNDNKFKRLFNEWVNSRYNKQLKPSLDRIDSLLGYTTRNTKMLTWAENRYKQSAMDGKRGRKPAVYQMLGDKVIKRFKSQRHVVKELGVSQSNLSAVLNGKRNYVSGYSFKYEVIGNIHENPELLANKE